MPRVEVRALGPFSVLVDGEERAISSRKQRALIATLALRPGGRSRDSVIAELWPESDDERGRQSLRHALYEINAVVGAEVITATGDTLRIADGVRVDVRELKRAAASESEDDLRSAVDLYGGDVCPEVEGVDGEAERVRLRGVFAGAGETLAARRVDADTRDAERIARRVIEVDPYREEAHRILLRALANAGDVAAAAAHYKRLTSLLREELGVELSAETKRVYASLGRPAQTAQARVRRPPLEPPAELIGRRAEYATLMGLVSDAIDGRGGTALVTGEAGAGKSRLLEEIASVAERHGLRVLRARASGAEGALPYQLWVDALAGCAADAAALPAPWPAVLATLLPDASRDNAGEVAPELRRTRLFEAVARLLAQVAASVPAVVVLDDLHEADPDSIHLLHYVARTSRKRRLAIATASRPVAGGPLEDARTSLEARDELSAIALAPLAPDAVAELVTRFGASGDAAWLAPRIADWTSGNPFFVLEALRALIAQGRLVREDEGWIWAGPPPAADEPLAPDLPSTVRETILARMGALPDATRRVVDLMAVAGTPVRLETVAAVAGRDELSLADDLAPALDAGLIRDARTGTSSSLVFAHDLVRDATYQRIPRTVRAAIHRRVAAVLGSGGGNDRAIAFHLTAGGDAARAADHWIAAAREAEASFAHDDAIRAYRSALEAGGASSPRRAVILMAIGDEQMGRGSVPAAVSSYDEALAATDDRDLHAALGARIASAARYYHLHPRAAELAAAAVDHYRARGPNADLAKALIGLGRVHYQEGDAAAAHREAEEARLLARSLGAARAEAHALHLSVWSRWLAGDDKANPDLADVERLAAALGDDEAAAYLFMIASTALTRAGRMQDAVGLARTGLDIARRVGSLRAELELGEELAGVLRGSGAPREAIELADEVRSDTVGLDLREAPRLLGELVLALADAGDIDRAVALANDLIAHRPVAPVHLSPAALAVRALLELGRPPAREILESQRPTCRTCEMRWAALLDRLEASSAAHA